VTSYWTKSPGDGIGRFHPRRRLASRAVPVAEQPTYWAATRGGILRHWPWPTSGGAVTTAYQGSLHNPGN
jgi:hypothetical protein